MTIESIKARLAEIDTLQDDESISDEEYDSLEAEARQLTSLWGKLQQEQEMRSAPTIKPNAWFSSFLSSFKVNTTSKLTARQYDCFVRNSKDRKSIIVNGIRYDVNFFRSGFGAIVVTQL